MFFANLESTLDQCSRGDVVIVLGDFSVVTGTDWAGYEMCNGPNGCGTRNNSSSHSKLVRSKRLKIAGSWYQGYDE